MAARGSILGEIGDMHEAGDKQFEYSGTNSFTARIEAVAIEAKKPSR